MPTKQIHLAKQLEKISDYWVPKVVGELNGQYVKLVKLLGEFVWHTHKDEDELFLVLHGQIVIQFRNRQVRVREGELFIVPRGTEHRTVAREEAHVLLFEPVTTVIPNLAPARRKKK